MKYIFFCLKILTQSPCDVVEVASVDDDGTALPNEDSWFWGFELILTSGRNSIIKLNEI